MKRLLSPDALFALGALVFAPAALAHYLTGANWLQVAGAFVLWFFGLWVLLGGPRNPRNEGVGWAVILSMFFGWIGVPLLALMIRLVTLAYS